jgi:hypothetical protein
MQMVESRRQKMRWHALKLEMDRTGTGLRVWKLLWAASVTGEPVDQGNAVFLSQEERGCVTLYFSPAARLLATSLGARPCERPDPATLTLLAGSTAAWDAHFAPPRASAFELRRAAA